MSNREAFLAEAKAAREARKADRDREIAAVKLQSVVRGWLRRINIEKEAKENVDKLTNKNSQNPHDANDFVQQKPTALELYYISQSYLAFGARSLMDATNKSVVEDLDRFERLCRIISETLKEESPKYSYISMAINKDKCKASSNTPE